MRAPWSKLEGPARLLVICLTVLLIAGGLCGLQFLMGDALSDRLSGIFIVTGILELGAICVSAVLAVGALIAWLISAIAPRD